MSRVLTRANAFVQQKSVENRVSRVERINAQIVLKDIDTTGKTSAQIDAAVFSNGSTPSTNAQPTDGLVISDSTNNLLLVRQSGTWERYSYMPASIQYTDVVCTTAWGSGTTIPARKLPDGTVEFAQNLYCTGQPSASSIQVSSGFPPALVPGDTYNSGWAIANYDDTWPYVAYFPNSAPFELWIRTQDGSARTEWNPIFNSLRYSAIPT